MATLERAAIPAGLDDVLDQLDALRQSTDSGEDFRAPTPGAIARMQALLTGAGGFLASAFPLGTLSADGDGGLRLEWIRPHRELRLEWIRPHRELRLEWIRPHRELRLVVSASEQGRSYLYHEAGADYGADYSPDAEKLGRGLNWLDFGGKAS